MGTTETCPNCGGTESWLVFATTPVGVRLPGEPDSKAPRQSKRELCICDDCGVCYDPVIADSDSQR